MALIAIILQPFLVNRENDWKPGSLESGHPARSIQTFPTSGGVNILYQFQKRYYYLFDLDGQDAHPTASLNE